MKRNKNSLVCLSYLPNKRKEFCSYARIRECLEQLPEKHDQFSTLRGIDHYSQKVGGQKLGHAMIMERVCKMLNGQISLFCRILSMQQFNHPPCDADTKKCATAMPFLCFFKVFCFMCTINDQHQ